MKNTYYSLRGIDKNFDYDCCHGLGAMRLAQSAILLLSLSFPGLQTAGFAVPGKNLDSASATRELIDINRASAVELKTLPGIQDAYAAAIVKNRQRLEFDGTRAIDVDQSAGCLGGIRGFAR